MEFWMQTMDVNLRRLADKIILILKFLVRLTIFMQHPYFDGRCRYPRQSKRKDSL